MFHAPVDFECNSSASSISNRCGRMPVTFDEFLRRKDETETLKHYKICLTTFSTDPRYGLKDHQLFQPICFSAWWNVEMKLLVFPTHFIDYEAPQEIQCVCLCDIAIESFTFIWSKGRKKQDCVFFSIVSSLRWTKGWDSTNVNSWENETQTQANRTGHSIYKSFDRSTECPNVRWWQ